MLEVRIKENWHQATYTDSLFLPGTTDIAKKDVNNTDHTDIVSVQDLFSKGVQTGKIAVLENVSYEQNS